jgi:hypothetical protein
MVNFNNDTTVTTAPADIVKITRLEKRYNLFEAMEAYYKDLRAGQDTEREIIIVGVRALNLAWELAGELKRKGQDMKDIKTNLLSNKEELVISQAEDLNLFCDDIGLTRIDIKKVYDTTRVENENYEKRI